MSKLFGVLRKNFIAVGVVAVIGAVIVTVVVSNRAGTMRETREGCAELQRMLDGQMSARDVSAEAPVRRNDMQDDFRRECPGAMNELDAIDERLTGSGSGSGSGSPEFSEPEEAVEPEAELDTSTDCANLALGIAMGNEPGSPWEGMTDEEVEYAEEFYYAYCE